MVTRVAMICEPYVSESMEVELSHRQRQDSFDARLVDRRAAPASSLNLVVIPGDRR